MMSSFKGSHIVLLWFLALSACDDTSFGESVGSASDGSDDAGGSDAGGTGGEIEGEGWCAVQSLFNLRCSACHGSSGDLNLSNDPYASLVGQPSSTDASLVLVVPGDLAASFLYTKVSGTQTSDQGAAMPPEAGGAAADLLVLADWINEGASEACDGPVDTGNGKRFHPMGYAESDVHGPEAKYQEQDCTSCHGADLAGSDEAISCDTCHEGGAEWRENCTYCHGGTDNITGAPPRDISGETATALLSYQVHTSHVTTNWHEAFDCEQCHQKPTDVLSIGHLFVEDNTPGVSEVDFTGGLSSSGSYEGNGSCSNLYCHGDGQRSNGEVLHTMDDLSCTSCHPDQTSDDDDWDEMSGEHEKHLDEGAKCSDCHSATTDPNQNILAPALHVNGLVEIAPTNGVVWNSSSRSCDGECHIGDEDEDHRGDDGEWEEEDDDDDD